MNRQLSKQPLIGAARIQQRVTELAAEIRERHGERPVVLVAVLKGALHFASDLMRALGSPATIEFVRAKSYQGDQSTGNLRFTFEDDLDVTGKTVILVEDVLDTGRTAHAIREALFDCEPAHLEMCVLLDKPGRRETPVSADYVGFTIGDDFVVGYGLDLDEAYRELPAVYVLEKSPAS